MEESFDNPLINITFLCGLLFIIVGYIMRKFPPKKINALYGYRTASSMKSQERWDFAQRYAAQQMIKSGALFVACSLLGFVSNFDPMINMVIGLGILLFITILLIWRIEKELKQKFGKK